MSIARLPSLGALLLASMAAGCGGDGDGGASLEPTYENVEATLEASCAFSSSCHGGTGTGRARLNLRAAIDSGDARTALVDQTACEYDAMPRVDPGHPEGSWLMIKIAGDHDGDGTLLFEPDPSWDHGLVPGAGGALPASTCPLTVAGALSFGTLMPQVLGAPAPLSEEEIEMFRRWIALGAPGPGE